MAQAKQADKPAEDVKQEGAKDAPAPRAARNGGPVVQPIKLPSGNYRINY